VLRTNLPFSRPAEAPKSRALMSARPRWPSNRHSRASQARRTIARGQAVRRYGNGKPEEPRAVTAGRGPHFFQNAPGVTCPAPAIALDARARSSREQVRPAPVRRHPSARPSVLAVPFDHHPGASRRTDPGMARDDLSRVRMRAPDDRARSGRTVGTVHRVRRIARSRTEARLSILRAKKSSPARHLASSVRRLSRGILAAFPASAVRRR
jgi:hypothetical protein